MFVFVFFFFFFPSLFFFFFWLFRATPAACGGSQAGVLLELQLPAYDRTTETQDLTRICNLHHSSWQRWILNALSEARVRRRNLMVPSGIHFCCATTGTPCSCLFCISVCFLLPFFLFLSIFFFLPNLQGKLTKTKQQANSTQSQLNKNLQISDPYQRLRIAK